jgi:hypothetical protein
MHNRPEELLSYQAEAISLITLSAPIAQMVVNETTSTSAEPDND